MCGIKPGESTAPAKPGDGEARGVPALTDRPLDAGVEVGHDLLVGDFSDDFRDEALHVGIVLRLALTVIEFDRNRHIALARESPANVSNMLVHAENFLNHQDDGCTVLARGRSVVGGYGVVEGGQVECGVPYALIGLQWRATGYVRCIVVDHVGSCCVGSRCISALV